VAESAEALDWTMVVMESAPAAILGATYDPIVGGRDRKLIANIGNFHTLAFRLGPAGIEGVFEHHTGEIDLRRLEELLRALADGSLIHENVFNDMGHGALVYGRESLGLNKGEYDVAVTGPRRSMFRRRHASERGHPDVEPAPLRPYFAVPFGDMMLSGCFGLLSATAEVLPNLREQIYESMRGTRDRSTAPWDLD